MPRLRRSKFRARGFQAILWTFGLFVVTNLTWLGMTQFVYPAFWDLTYKAKSDAMRARISQAPNRPLWLLFGTSKLQQGFRPLMLDPKLTAPDAPLIYNFGLPGADALREWICLRRLHADGRSLGKRRTGCGHPNQGSPHPVQERCERRRDQAVRPVVNVVGACSAAAAARGTATPA